MFFERWDAGVEHVGRNGLTDVQPSEDAIFTAASGLPMRNKHERNEAMEKASAARRNSEVEHLPIALPAGFDHVIYHTGFKTRASNHQTPKGWIVYCHSVVHRE